MNDYRIFILGAGFSYAAGLPLAQELWNEVLNRARKIDWIIDELDYELNEYNRFRKSRGEEVSSNDFDFEDFLGFLDVEHSLGFQGSDTLTKEGNKLQLVLKWLIAQVIVERTPTPDNLPECYLEFAKTLQSHDLVITFNYDTVLEASLDMVGKPYRLFPTRYTEINEMSGTVDSSHDEVVILKLHGSVDWFDSSDYLDQEQRRRRHGLNEPRDNLIFGPKSFVSTAPLLEGPQFDDNSLTTVHRITNGIKDLYRRRPPILTSPVLLAPSHMKVLYANRLKYFFWGLGQAGGLNLGLIVIGYSLPPHDDYARQILLRIFANYQRSWWEEDCFGFKKKPALLIDLRNTSESEDNYKKSYSFVEQDKAQYYLRGFDSHAIDFIQNES